MSHAPACPPDLAALLAEIGPRWAQDIRGASEAVKQAYAPLLAAAPRDGVRVLHDLGYGTHPRQRLDLFLPAVAATPAAAAAAPASANSAASAAGAGPDGARLAPLVVFVHGGAFIRGDRSQPSGIYDNVLTWFARQGLVGVNVEYRLAPEAPFPGGVDDLALALGWLQQHARAYGGDPRRLLLIGHSAGGTHVASYVFDPRLGHLGRGVTAAVLISARLMADVAAENPNAGGVRAYFGDDPARYAERSPISHAGCSDLPTFVVIAGYENPLLDRYGIEFASRLAQARRRAPWLLQLPQHNHISIVAHFNTGEETLGRAILEFFDAACREASSREASSHEASGHEASGHDASRCEASRREASGRA
ncbi:MAG: alpha/beta hydrolase [Lautropia sp.]